MIAALALLLLAPLTQDGVEAGLAAARELPLPAVELDDLDRWRAHLRPAGDELAFERVGWIPDFAEGIRRSSEEGDRSTSGR